MNIEQVKEVAKLCAEVQTLASNVNRKHEEYRESLRKYNEHMRKNPNGLFHYPSSPFSGSKETAALRRRSMDLTKALAELRK